MMQPILKRANHKISKMLKKAVPEGHARLGASVAKLR
jgi:hypothetical protein